MSPIIETSTGWVMGMVWVAGTGAAAAAIGTTATWLGALLGVG